MTFPRLLDAITAPPVDRVAAAQRHLDSLTKPPGSLGRLEELAIKVAGITGQALPRIEHRVITQGGLVLWCHNGNGMEAPVAACRSRSCRAAVVASLPQFPMTVQPLGCGVCSHW